MEETQHRAAAEHQRGATVAVAGADEKVFLLGQRDDRLVHLVDIVQCAADLADELVDEVFGAQLGLVVQRGLAHATKVAVHALVEGEQQLVIILAKTQVADQVETLTNGPVVVALGGIRAFPVVQTVFMIVGGGELRPLLVGLGGIHFLQNLP